MDGDQTGTATAPAEQPQEQDDAPPRPARRRARAKDGPPAVARVRVTYDDVDEFLEQLAEDVVDVEGGIVRVTVRELPDLVGWLERRMQLFAGYVVAGNVQELFWQSANYWSNRGEPTDEVTAALAPQLGLVKSTCEAGGLEVRGGRFGAL